MAEIAKKEKFDVNSGAGKDTVLLPGILDDVDVAALDAVTWSQVFERFTSLGESKKSGFSQAISELVGDANFKLLNAELAKAIQAPPTSFAFSRINYMPDPNASGVLPWPGIAPEALAKIARENVAPQLIIGMRCDDVLRYSNLSSEPWRPGWRIEKKENSDSDEQASDSEKKDILDAQRFLLNSNIETKYTQARERDGKRLTGFQTFLSAGTRDWLTFDELAIWTDTDNQGKVKAYSLLPAGNIRLATFKGYQNKPEQFAVGVDEGGKVIEIFTRDQLIFKSRNPRTNIEISGDLFAAGYGYCYSEDTEVLTRDGWKCFSDVRIDLDEFATLNLQNRDFEWQKASHKTWMPYVGEMYGVGFKTIDLLVTPQHRIVYQCTTTDKKEQAPFKVSRAVDLFNKHIDRRINYKIPSTSIWRGTKIPQQKFLSATAKIAVDMTGDEYCAFMGAYLAEGYVPHNKNCKNVYICQREKSKGFESFKKLFTKILGKEVYHCGREFVICRKSLADHVCQFGRYAHEKFIPQEIMDATSSQIWIFLQYYILGDGRIQNKKIISKRVGHLGGKSYQIATVSKKMADQLQELAQKAGYSATISITKAKEAQSFQVDSWPNVDGTVRKYKYVSQTRDCYCVSLRGSKSHSFSMKKTTYHGMIGCVTVPNGTLYVRRNGKACWSGNSEIEQAIRLIQGFQNAIDMNVDVFNKNGVPNAILTIVGATQRQLDFINRLWTNIKRGITKKWAMPVIGLPSKEAELKLIDLSGIEGKDAYYKDWMNMLAGALCTVYRFPVRRLGYRISGHGRDTEPLPDSAVELVDEDDPGLAPLLGHWETVINEYLLWSRWPHLKFRFTGATPKEDNRQFEWRRNAMTWSEARKTSGLPKLEKIYSSEHKLLAEIMDGAPIDANLSGLYQTIAASYIQSKLGLNTGSAATPGGKMTEKKDPARSEKHGHPSGVRRDSASE